MANTESEVQNCHVYALATGLEDAPATRDSVLATADTRPAARGRRCCNPEEEGGSSKNSRPQAAKDRGLQPRSSARRAEQSRRYLSRRGLSRDGNLEPVAGWLPRGQRRKPIGRRGGTVTHCVRCMGATNCCSACFDAWPAVAERPSSLCPVGARGMM